MGHLVIDRKQWGATDLPSGNGKPIPLKHPIPYVFLTHIGVQSKPCNNVYNCSIKMRTIQDSAIAEKRFTDISANFYVSFYYLKKKAKKKENTIDLTQKKIFS